MMPEQWSHVMIILSDIDSSLCWCWSLVFKKAFFSSHMIRSARVLRASSFFAWPSIGPYSSFCSRMLFLMKDLLTDIGYSWSHRLFFLTRLLFWCKVLLYDPVSSFCTRLLFVTKFSFFCARFFFMNSNFFRIRVLPPDKSFSFEPWFFFLCQVFFCHWLFFLKKSPIVLNVHFGSAECHFMMWTQCDFADPVFRKPRISRQIPIHPFVELCKRLFHHTKRRPRWVR